MTKANGAFYSKSNPNCTVISHVLLAMVCIWVNFFLITFEQALPDMNSNEIRDTKNR